MRTSHAGFQLSISLAMIPKGFSGIQLQAAHSAIFDPDAEFFANAALIRGREALEADGRAKEYRKMVEKPQMQITMLRTQIDGLKAENARLQAQADVDAAHAAGLIAEKDALIKEADNCPERQHHYPLVVRK